VGFRDRLGERQAEPASVRVASRGVLAPVEALEHAPDLVGRDAGAVVRDAQENAARARVERDLDGAAGA
jgi:hypothetical protein